MKPAQVRKQIQSGETAPLYLLEGDDLQSRHDLASEFAAMVEEGLQAFNVQSFYANEATNAALRDQLIGDILSTARTLPMMAPRRVVLVHQAEHLLSPRKAKDDEETPATSGDKKRRKAVTAAEELEAYLETPEQLTTMVFVAGDLDANRRLVKQLRNRGVVVDCGSLDNDADASKWIEKRLENEGFTIDRKAVTLLLESTGLSLGRIRGELEKLVLYASGEKAISARHVQDLVMPQSEPGERFALGYAIWDNNAPRALRELAAEFDTGKPAFMILGLVRAAAARLKPDDRARRGLDAVFAADLAIKSSIGEPQYVLERLVVELCTRR